LAAIEVRIQPSSSACRGVSGAGQGLTVFRPANAMSEKVAESREKKN